MRIAIIGSNINEAAELVVGFKQYVKSAKINLSLEFEFCESFDDPKLSTSNLVIADPYPDSTGSWLYSFRRCNPHSILLLLSSNTDLISGSVGDNSYCMSRPYVMRELFELVRTVGSGQLYKLPIIGRQKEC